MRRILFSVSRLILFASAAVLLASCADTADDSADTSVAQTTTTAEAAAGPIELVGTYDGEDCTYEGAKTTTLDDEISLTLVNDAADAAFLRMLLVPPDRVSEIEPQVGSDFDFSAGRTAFLNPTLYAEAAPFANSTALAFLPSPGTYLVECASVDGAAPSHVWWLAVFEVTP